MEINFNIFEKAEFIEDDEKWIRVKRNKKKSPVTGSNCNLN